jgi:hypothetical protein
MYDIVKNPIPTSKLFYTPATEQELLERIQSFPSAERAVAFQIAMMTFNLCNRLVDSEILSKEVFAS